MLTDPTSGPPPAPTPSSPPPPPPPPVSDQTSTPATPPTTSTTYGFPTGDPSLSSGGPLPETTEVPTTSSEVSGTGAMPTVSTSTTAFSTTTSSSASPESTSSDASGIGSNRTLVITLSTVLSVVGLLLVVGAILICWKYRRHRAPFFSRGISPIDDDEIATWKVPRNEKAGMTGGETDVEAEGAALGAAAGARDGGSPTHAKHASTSSIKKPPSVIVYSNAHGQGGYQGSVDEGSPRSFAQSSTQTTPYGKASFDKALPQTPIQARAPNARAGLTDEAIPGDDPFLPSPKRQPSRLSKMPPGFSSQRRAHTRARSSRSSTHSFGGYGYASSDVGLSPRHSHDNYVSPQRTHTRVYSSSSIPPRLSFGDEGLIGGLSPRPLFRDDEIGKAIG
ncbi:hypothetical protein B0H66DRAFT_597734 [Apodospora peruviana]|uniref:Uncharacterized protein n=1 Tax=Apodospora peruviana TaxID=516989 RepID=A0AAE0IS67_9PEZI|nr:hypothetical protein B0H66DRAFT_597734 [Apodospora peruviana]